MPGEVRRSLDVAPSAAITHRAAIRSPLVRTMPVTASDPANSARSTRACLNRAPFAIAMSKRALSIVSRGVTRAYSGGCGHGL